MRFGRVSQGAIVVGVALLFLGANLWADGLSKPRKLADLAPNEQANLPPQPANPPEGMDGNCGTWVLIPAQFRTVTDQVLVKPAGVDRVFIPPTYKTMTERLVVTPESFRDIPIPASYKTITEQVLVTPESFRDIPIPAAYKTVTEHVMVSPARKEWRKVDCTEVDLAPGEIQGDSYCLFDVPPVFEDRTRQVLERPASSRREMIPAVYKTVEKQVMDRPASVRHEIIPAVFKDVTKQVQTGGGRWEEHPYPAAYKTVERQEKVSDARWEWRLSHECCNCCMDLTDRDARGNRRR